jgi:citrate lyase subunit beta/citryl-CoA lyase
MGVGAMSVGRSRDSALIDARVPLFVPGDQPQRFAKAATSGADAVILDLEDAVAPEKKDAARQAVVAHAVDAFPVIVRINAVGSGFHADDVQAVRRARFDALMLAKCESGEDVDRASAAVPGDTAIIPLIESARGLLALPEILARRRVVRLAFGAFDFSLDIGCRPQWNPLITARGELVWRSRAAEKAQPWDSPSAEIRALTAVKEEAELAAAAGFGGKMAIHPAQVAVIDAAFRPDAAAIAWAREVVAAVEHSELAKVGGVMVDAPIIERARRILRDAQRFS